MADPLQVEIVSADRLVWSGQATEVLARTSEGEIGILSDHTPVLSVLVPCDVKVLTVEGDDWSGVVGSGFLSVAGNRVSMLVEYAQEASGIDLGEAERDIEALSSAPADDEQAQEALRLATAKVKVARRVS